MSVFNDELIRRTSLPELAQTWQEAQATIREAFAKLAAQEAKLQSIFGQETCHNFRVNQWAPEPGKHVSYQRGGTPADFADPDGTIRALHLSCWRVLVDRMGIKSLLSVERRKQLDAQMESGDGLPEITEANITAMLEGTAGNVKVYLEEAVREVFNFLRPRQRQHGTGALKTNDSFKVGKKVILHWAEAKYNNGGWRIRYHYDQECVALDNAFSSLDGKGTIKTYHGPLHDAIEASGVGGVGETEYFRFRCCLNGNLHLEFKRMDLVDQLNAIGGKGLKASA